MRPVRVNTGNTHRGCTADRCSLGLTECWDWKGTRIQRFLPKNISHPLNLRLDSSLVTGQSFPLVALLDRQGTSTSSNDILPAAPTLTGGHDNIDVVRESYKFTANDSSCPSEPRYILATGIPKVTAGDFPNTPRLPHYWDLRTASRPAMMWD